MFKINPAPTADCVVSGFRWHKKAPDIIGSLLLGLFDGMGKLHHVGVTSSFTMEKRQQLVGTRAASQGRAGFTPWRAWPAFARTLGGQAVAHGRNSAHARGQSRWAPEKICLWEPLRIERGLRSEGYDHMQGDRFRLGDVPVLAGRQGPEDCRYDQLEVTPAYELAAVFGASRDTPRVCSGLASATGSNGRNSGGSGA